MFLKESILLPTYLNTDSYVLCKSLLIKGEKINDMCPIPWTSYNRLEEIIGKDSSVCQEKRDVKTLYNWRLNDTTRKGACIVEWWPMTASSSGIYEGQIMQGFLKNS